MVGSTPPRVHAEPPKRVFAFVSHADGLELKRLAQVGDRIGVLAPNWYGIDLATGAIRGPSQRGPLLRAARRAGVPVWPVVNASTGGSPAIDDAAARRRATRAIARVAAKRGHAGVTLDIEELLPSQRDAYSALVARVARLVRRRGGHLAVYAPRPTGVGSSLAYDWHALARSADLLLVSTYNEHGPSGPPGPLDSSTGFASVLARGAEISRERVVPIVGAIGYAWPRSGRRALMLSVVEALRWRKRCRATPRVAADGGSSYACRGRTVHHPTTRGLRARARSVGVAGFRWLALFSLGREPLGFWKAWR